MKACPVCRRLYAADAGFCHADGEGLVEARSANLTGASESEKVGVLVAGRYLIYRVVADGGMARVFEALDIEADRHVALKVLHPEMLRDGISIERFEREAEVGRQLHHQHIVEVGDFLPTPWGSQALVMEFLAGEELRSVLKREGRLGPARLVRMLSQLALGLDQAHAESFVHRDLKPENIFLCQTPQGDIVKILDFGSVKDRASKRKLTIMGTTIGSPFYMSPEQAQGLEDVDHRTDIWALGTIVYECLTGQVPFEGANGPTILFQILSAHPLAPSRRAPGLPSALDVALASAMAKSRQARPNSAGEFANAVGQAFGLSGSHTDWAQASEDELGRRIERRAKSEPPAASDSERLQDEFFAAPDLTASSRDGVNFATSPPRGRGSRRLSLVLGTLAVVLLGAFAYWYVT